MAQNGALATQVRDRDRQIIKLSDEILSFRIGLAEVGLGQAENKASSEVKTQMIKSFFEQLGGLGHSYIAAKLGIEPELVAILEILRKDAVFMEALKNPKVKRVLADDQMRAMIVETIQGIAASLPDDPESANTAGPTEP
jgi:hypothetical protein